MKKAIFLMMWAMLLAGSQEAIARKGEVTVNKHGVTAVVDSDTVVSIKADLSEALEDSGYNYNYAEDEDGNEVQDTRIERRDHSSSPSLLQGVDNEDFNEVMMYIIVVFIVFLSLTVLGLAIVYYRYRTKQAKYEVAAKALENGQPIPDGLLGNTRTYADFERRERRQHSDARAENPSSTRYQQPARPVFSPSGGTLFRKFLSVIGYLYNTNRNMHRGLNQFFVGLGLWAFFSYANWPDFFVGISILVMVIALGMMVAGYLETEFSDRSREENPQEEDKQ
jgi:hypothetical protein